MVSMYDMIMDFPLFKGISRDHVSAMLEKTNVYFRRYGAGDNVCSAGDNSDRVGFLVRGEIMMSIRSIEVELRIVQTLGPGTVIGADTLFGWDTKMNADIVTLTACSIMYVSKEEYMSLLNDDPIYLMNYLNYLSLLAQQSRKAVRQHAGCGVTPVLSRWLLSHTNRRSREIKILADVDTIVATCGKSYEETMDELRLLEDKGLIKLTPGSVEILSRLNFLDHSGPED